MRDRERREFRSSSWPRQYGDGRGPDLSPIDRSQLARFRGDLGTDLHDAAADGAGFATDSVTALRAFVQQIRNGKAFDLPGDGVAIPVDGLTAALLRMDDRQGRVGRETAQLSPGPMAATEVPAVTLPFGVRQRFLDKSMT